MRRPIGFSMMAALAAATLAVATRADEEKIPLDKVPPAVTKAVKDKFPEAELKGASKEVEGGVTLYEVSLKHEGHDYDVTLNESGTFAEIEKEIAAADLPRPVADAVMAKYPKAKLGKAEEVVKGDKMSFEVHLEDGGTSRELVLDPAGKILEEGEGEGDEG